MTEALAASLNCLQCTKWSDTETFAGVVSIKDALRTLPPAGYPGRILALTVGWSNRAVKVNLCSVAIYP